MTLFRNTAEAVQWATSVLHEHRQQSWALARTQEETERAIRHEVETLLCFATGWSRIRLLTSLGDPLPTAAVEMFRTAVNERSHGKPLQYITGTADFYGRTFRVRPGCLIPRPETEVLAEATLQWLAIHRPQGRVLDLGTGSGILAITLALEAPNTRVSAVDISVDALHIARENAATHRANVDFVHADGIDVFAEPSRLPNERLPWNVLVSNPPYIPSAEVLQLDAEVQDWEPSLALDGGVDGLDIYRRIRDVGSDAFETGAAALFLEVGADQAEDVRALFVEHNERWPNWTFGILPDLRGVGRVVWGERTGC